MALIEIRPGNYISRVWFLSSPKASFDVLMVLRRELPSGPWTLAYRFRYYKDEQAFGSEDEKSAWTATFTDDLTEEAAVRKAGPVIQRLRVMARLDLDVTRIESDDPLVFFAQIKNKPWAHQQIVPRSS